jgi:hypothetical protein
MFREKARLSEPTYSSPSNEARRTDSMFKKSALFFSLSLVIHLYTTLVLTLLWNWFVVPVFHVSQVSFWLMYGLVLVINMLQSPSEDSNADRRTKTLMTAIEACIPEDHRQLVREELERQNNEIWIDLGALMFGRAFGVTVTLGIAFIVHVLASA